VAHLYRELESHIQSVSRFDFKNSLCRDRREITFEDTMSKYNTDALRVSYGIGRQFGGQLKNQPFDGLDIESVLDGFRDAFTGAADPVVPADMQQAYDTIRAELEAKEAEAATTLAADGEAFMAENAQKDGVVVTASGLQYEVLTEGTGEKPTQASTISAHYHGTLINGDVFDSSYDRGQPAEFPVGGVIPGWTEALQLMAVGSKWRLTVPYQLAYGAQGAGGAIGPYQTLVFDVELLAIL
jgi:FKBP-type peptidyl-prolyl cis-trans isomerase FklB